MIARLEPEANARAVVDLALLTHRNEGRPLIASSGGQLVLEAERSAIRHTRMPLHKRGLFSCWRNRVQLEALVRRTRPDIIHAHGIDVLGAACSISASHHIPLLVDLCEPIASTSRNRRLLRHAVARGAYFRVPSAFMAEYLQKDLKLKSPQLYKVTPGVDLNWFEASRITAERAQALSRLWRVPETSTILLMATPLMPGQGHKFLLQALAQLKRPDIFTVFVGKPVGNFGAELEKIIHASGLSGQVVMTDYCYDWPAACWVSNLVIAVNSWPRGCAPELLAAQAVGRPVIVTDCGANGEFVKSGETAWVIPKDDLASLKAAVDEATRLTTDQRIDLAERTRAFVGESFTQKSWVEATFELYTMMSGVRVRTVEKTSPKAA